MVTDAQKRQQKTAVRNVRRSQRVKKALLQGVPPSADGGIKLNPVIFEDMCLGNDTSHEILADNFARNRGQNSVQPFSKKWRSHFF